jgi:hypothetical protein
VPGCRALALCVSKIGRNRRSSRTEWCKTFPTFPPSLGATGKVGNVRAQLPALRLTEPSTSWLVCVLQRGSPSERNPKRPRIACMTATCRWSVALRSACISTRPSSKRGCDGGRRGERRSRGGGLDVTTLDIVSIIAWSRPCPFSPSRAAKAAPARPRSACCLAGQAAADGLRVAALEADPTQRSADGLQYL